MNKKIELLAPAGDFNKAKTAIDFGADAVYIGGTGYSLRARANNFSLEDISKISTYVHSKHKKWYLVVNVLCQNHMLTDFADYFKKVLPFKPDACIASDPFIISQIKKISPQTPIHVSTQQSITNSKASLFFKRNGAERVILSREVSYRELTPLIKNVKDAIDIETFAHGAVCIGYSGRCMLSNNFCLRDSNIGGCAQSCRWVMSLYDDKKLYSDKFTMSAKDMCLISKVEQLIKIGISSLKIEGRMKSEYYIATIVKAYRNAIDAIYRNEHNIDDYIKDAAKAANRSADIAWFDKNPNCHKMLYYEKQQTVTQNFAFVINKKINSNTYEITVKNNMKMSDKYELISKNFNKTINIKILQMKNKDMDSVTVFPTPQAIGTITFEKDIELQIGDIGRITSI